MRSTVSVICGLLFGVVVGLPALADDRPVVPSAMFKSEVQVFRDNNGRLMGRTFSLQNGDIEGRTNTGLFVGKYSTARDTTYDMRGRLFGRGNQLPSMIVDKYRDAEARKKATAPGGLMTDPDAPVIGPLTDMSPAAEGRRQAMKAHITDGDRLTARQALSKAGVSPFMPTEWRNYETGHHGSWYLREVDQRSSRWMNGVWVECRFATMTLVVGQYTDIQQQTVCPAPGVGWAVVLVNGDR
jgi:hypothetical protein